MKKTLKLISLILSVIMILSAFAACSRPQNDETEENSDNALSSDTNGNESEDAGNDEDAPPADITKFPENVFPIFDGSLYAIKVVCSDTATELERSIATKLRSALKSKTKKTISTSTDYLKKGQSYDPNVYEILVGETNHEESKGVYRSVPYSNYGIRIIGRKMVIYFSNAIEGEEIISKLTSSIKRGDNGALWVADDLSMSKIASLQITSIPKYPSTSLSTVDCDDDTTLVVAKNTDLASFNTYCEELVSKNGYEEYSKRENVDGNYFRTYTKGNGMIYAYYSNGRKQARIISGPIKDIPANETNDAPETFKPSITMIGPSESVSGSLTIIYMLANGKFLIIDGGIILADRIYKELKELQPNATKFTIAGWFISHPHNDHQDGIEYFLEQHAYEVEIENIYFNYATASYYNEATDKDHLNEKEGTRVSNLRNLLDKYSTHSTKIVKPHTGQIYKFGSATVEIMSTVEDILPSKMPFVNDTSMVIRVTVAGQSTMILADASINMKSVIRSMYDSHVKSDMVTLAHHGVWDNTPELYNEINAKVVFWPNNTEGARMYYNKSSTSEARKAIVAALNNAKDVFLAKGTDTKLNLPYTPVGNKQSFINNTLK